MRFGPREIIFLLVLIAMPALAYFLVFQPRSVRISQARAEIQSKQERLSVLNSDTGEYASLSEETEQLRQLVEKSRQRLPDAAQVDAIIHDIDEKVRLYKLKTESVRRMDDLVTPHWGETRMSVVMTGNFMDFYGFLRDMENMQRITKVSKLKIERTMTSGAPEGQMKAEFLLSIFYESPNAA